MTTPPPGPGTASAGDVHTAARTIPSGTGPSRREASGFRAFAARRPVAALLILVFSIAYPLMFLVVLVQHGVIPGKALLERLPMAVDEFTVLVLTAFALLPSALYVTWAADGRTGVVDLLRRVTRWRFGAGWWLFILTALPVLTVASGVLLGDRLAAVDPMAFLRTQVPALVIQLVLINLWEETAWAGVMQTRLQRRHTVLVAGLITAVPFGLVHWPLAFLGDITVLTLTVAPLAYILLGVLVRPLAGLTMRGARDSVLAFALVHSTFNRTNNGGGIADTLLDGSGYQLGLLGVLAVLTTALALALRGRLRPSHRREPERRDSSPEPPAHPTRMASGPTTDSTDPIQNRSPH